MKPKKHCRHGDICLGALQTYSSTVDIQQIMLQRSWSSSSLPVRWKMNARTQRAKQHGSNDCFSLDICVCLCAHGCVCVCVCVCVFVRVWTSHCFAPWPNSAITPILRANRLNLGLVCLSIQIDKCITLHAVCVWVESGTDQAICMFQGGGVGCGSISLWLLSTRAVASAVHPCVFHFAHSPKGIYICQPM